MQSHLRQRAFKYLAALAIAASCGALRARPRLLEIPETLVYELVEAVCANEVEWSKEDRRRVLTLLSSDPRVAIRARVAQAAVGLASEWTSGAQRLLSTLAADRAGLVRAAATCGLEELLVRASPIERVELVCQWAAAPQAAEREAVARALCSSISTVVTDLVLQQLSQDPVPAVRVAAVRASRAHFQEHPRLYRELLEERASDENRRVRRAARRMLGEVA